VTNRELGANAHAEQSRVRSGGALHRRGVVLATILAAAFGLRLAWALGVVSATRWKFAWDASFYDRLARELLEGKGFLWFGGEPTAYMLPGYPFLLAGAYGLFGNDLMVAKLLNVGLATLTCFFIYRIGLRAYDLQVGLLAAASTSRAPPSAMCSSCVCYVEACGRVSPGATARLGRGPAAGCCWARFWESRR
jgi:hypothetical protein